MAEKQAPKIVFYTTSCPSTLKVRGDIERITQILHAKRTVYEEIDLNMYPERRREMLLHNDGIISLPQLRVNGVYVGDGNTVQELEDFGELDEVLEPSGEVQELIDAARYGDLEDVAVALDSKTPVNGTDELGRTGLHMACANGHADVVRLLISSGADVTLANAEGNTALHWSCLNGHVEIIRLLVVAGASPSALNSHEKTPIDEALSHMQRDEILVAINLHASTGGGGGNADDEGFSFEVSEEADGGGFPQKPR